MRGRDGGRRVTFCSIWRAGRWCEGRLVVDQIEELEELGILVWEEVESLE
jgi:hypothetical protein